jgi:sarcosine oxidase subunit beta
MQTYDAIVIGAGVIGASISYHLAGRGLKVLVLERRHAACGASGSSSGLIRMHYELEAEARLAWVSFQYFRNWRERVGGECGFRRTGFLHIETPDHETQLRANVEMQRRIGVPAQVIPGEDIKKLAPAFRTDDIACAAYEPDSGYGDATLTTNSFLEAAKARRAVLIQDCEVTGLILSRDRVQGVRTTRGAFASGVVVNAAGAWAGRLCRLAGVQVPIDTWTHDVAHLRRPAAVGDHPTVIDNSLSMYFRPDAGGLTLVALEDDSRLGEPPDADLGFVAKDFVERVVERICRRIPAMEQGSLQSTLVGRDGLTPDQRAVIGRVGPQGFYLAAGFSGTGFKISPAVGLCVSELIVDGSAQTVDIAGFDPLRFARGKTLKGEHDYGPGWGTAPA